MMKKLISGIALLFSALCFLVPAADATADATFFIVETVGHTADTPHLEAGQHWNAEPLVIKNVSGEVVTIKSVEMIASGDLASFPFDPERQNYYEDFSSSSPVDNGHSFSYGFNGASNFRVRGDAKSQFYDIPVEISFSYDPDGPGSAAAIEDVKSVSFRVLVIEKPAEEVSTHIPKVIVSGFSTNPSQVIAGEEFTLSITFKNTSSSGYVENLKASLSTDGTFNPVSGSSTLFIASLSPGASHTSSIKLFAKADAAPSSYNVSLALNYDAPNTKDNQPVTDTEQIAIPVEQVPKANFQALQIVPSEIYLGQDFNLMSAVNNTGKSKLYNVNVEVSDSQNLTVKQEQYLGNIDSGGTGTIDLYISPQDIGSSTLTMKVSYEDEKGQSYSHSETAEINIMAREEIIQDFPMEPTTEEQGGSLWWLWVILGLIAAGVAALIIIKNRKKKAAAERDRAEAKKLERRLSGRDERAKTEQKRG
ncbi:MAG: CARDB domain-containing protein [Oscillospiraceae bacterium]|nr:CARDB domain-containing protein [Oscillospiraceae bacterium]